MANKPLGFPFGFFTNDNTPDSGKYFNRTATPPRPYLSVAEAMSVLPLGVRVAGLLINIAGVEYHWKPEWTTEALLNQDPVVRKEGIEIIDTTVAVDSTYSSSKIDTNYIPRLNKRQVSKGSTGGYVATVSAPKGGLYGEAYSNASGTKTTGILRIKLPLSYGNVIMKIEGSIIRQNPTELIKFNIGGYWSGGGAFAGGYRNWWSIDSAIWQRSLNDLADIPVRFGYELSNPADPTSVKNGVIYLGTTTTNWGSTAGFFIDKIYCLNGVFNETHVKDFVVDVIDNDSAIIANQSTVMLVPVEPISFLDKLISGTALTFTENDTKVSVGTGYYDIAGTTYNPPAMGVPFDIPTAHPTLPRRDVISGTQNLISGAVSYFKYYVGIPSENAVLPTIDAGEIIIRDILVSTAGVEPSAPDLSGFVTLDTPQTITSDKEFTKPIKGVPAINANELVTKAQLDSKKGLPAGGTAGQSLAKQTTTAGDAIWVDVPAKVGDALNLKLNTSAYNDRFKGKFTTLANLQTAFPTANSGDYAQVDAGAGVNAINYNYDTEEGWIQGGSGSGATNTDQLLEGATNLYYTEARVSANSAVSANTAKRSYPTADETKLGGLSAFAPITENQYGTHPAFTNQTDLNAYLLGGTTPPEPDSSTYVDADYVYEDYVF